ncbi:MAG: hypothetical protein MPK62_02710 [Alphaproteobacteria bacterium]|nr:hypothetical protein [Alphaproteobacteria bacterium]
MTEEEAKSLAIASWRLLYASQRICADLPGPQRKRAEARLRNARSAVFLHITRLLEQHGIEMPDFTGKPYDPNYPIRATNAEEFADGDILVVQETQEPALVKGGRVLHFAKVVLTRIENPDQQSEKKNVSGN